MMDDMAFLIVSADKMVADFDALQWEEAAICEKVECTEYMAKNFKELKEWYRRYQAAGRNAEDGVATIIEALFPIESTQELLAIVLKLKRRIIEYLKAHSRRFVKRTDDGVKVNGKTKKVVMKEMYVWLREELMKEEFTGIRCLFYHHMSVLWTETIVESVCSVIGDVYVKKKSGIAAQRVIDNVRARLCLSRTKTARDEVVNEVVKRYKAQNRGSHQYIQTDWYRRERRYAFSPSIDGELDMEDDSIFTL